MGHLESNCSITAPTGDAGVGKSSLLVRLTDQRFLANPDPTVGTTFACLMPKLTHRLRVS
jgi:GTP-binding protein EngB required for normal cell division